jgi:hypothetical protein
LHLTAEASLSPSVPTLTGGFLTAIADGAKGLKEFKRGEGRAGLPPEPIANKKRHFGVNQVA